MNIQINFTISPNCEAWAQSFKNMLRLKFNYTDITYPYSEGDSSTAQALFISIEQQMIENLTANNMPAVEKTFILPNHLDQVIRPIDADFGDRQPDFSELNAYPFVYCYRTLFMDDQCGGDLAIKQGRYYRTIEFMHDCNEEHSIVIKSELPGGHTFDYDCEWLRPLTDMERNNLEYIEEKVPHVI